MLLLYDIYLGILKNIIPFFSTTSQRKSVYFGLPEELNLYASVLLESVKYFTGLSIVS